MKTLKYAAFLLLAFVVSAAVGAKAGETPKANPFIGVLSATASAELPGKAADLVSQAAAKDREQTTIEVVNAAISLNPAAARATVGTIAHSSPEMAGTAAATAVAMLPDQDAMIASIAAAAAPGEAGKIVEAVCRVMPQDYQKIADAVAEIVPGAAREILTGVATAVPSLKGSIEQALVAENGGTPSVDKVLDQIASEQGKLPSGGGLAPQPNLSHGTQIPPYVSSGTPTDVLPSSGGQVPPGGRNYSSL